jgi:membrane-bound serine protease (ClpP class)
MMKPYVLVRKIVVLCLGIFWAVMPLMTTAETTSGLLPAVRVAGPINPVVASFIVAELEKANQSDARAFLIEMDTPGGLDSAMREIIQALLSSDLPVIVYISPPGARAASAGAFITLAADFAVMAPGTNIGAATPVSIGAVGNGSTEDSTMKAKILNDAVAYARSIAEQRGRNVDWAERIVRESISTPASEAFELRVIDLISNSVADLLRDLDGRVYLRGGKEQKLILGDVEITYAEMNMRQQILNTISNPTVAYLLMMLGILGIFFEISQPGVILPGVVGAIALLLAFFAFQTLPISYAGVLLILLAVVLFILEVYVTSFGMLSVGGVIALGFGSLMLIDSPEPYLQISRTVIVATVAAFSLSFGLCLYFIVRTQRRRFQSGHEGLVGEQGHAVTSVHDAGTVFVHGEYWEAFSEEPISQEESIEVVQLAPNMRLEVKKAIKG